MVCGLTAGAVLRSHTTAETLHITADTVVPHLIHPTRTQTLPTMIQPQGARLTRGTFRTQRPRTRLTLPITLPTQLLHHIIVVAHPQINHTVSVAPVVGERQIGVARIALPYDDVEGVDG